MTNHPNRNNTLSRFLVHSHINPSLVRAVVRQAGGWKAFKEMARDVTEYGADAGFSGFIYYTETVRFTNLNKKTIISFARNVSGDLGVSLYKMVSDVGCLKITVAEADSAIHEPGHELHDQVFNALAWFALEEVARSYDDMVSA